MDVVWYSYNGIKLAALPEFPEELPYLIIGRQEPTTADGNPTYWLYAADKHISIQYDNGYTVWPTTKETTYIYFYKYNSETNIWKPYSVNFPLRVGGSNFTGCQQPYWSNYDIPYKGSSDILLQASEPVLLYGDQWILEITPREYLEVTGFGETGITFGARVRNNTTGEIRDVSSEAIYSIYSIGANYASLNGNRELVIKEDCPLTSIGVVVKYPGLPEQTSTISVWIKTGGGDSGGDDGGGDSGGGDSGGDSGGGDTDTGASPEKLREAYWKGFISCAAMYG